MHGRIFVYGTLLRGQVNHRLLAGAVCLGPHSTAPVFTLFNLGTYPGLVRGGTTAVAGEVYRVDGATLCRLDALEDYPRLYGRVLIPTPYGATWVYHYRGRTAGPGDPLRRLAGADAGPGFSPGGGHPQNPQRKDPGIPKVSS